MWLGHLFRMFVLSGTIGAIPSINAAEVPSELVGIWTNAHSSDKAIRFAGSACGRISDQAGQQFFLYTVTNDTLCLRFGGGSNNTLLVSRDGDRLALAAASETSLWVRASSIISSCATNMVRLEAAKAVFFADHPGVQRVGLAELVPDYLPLSEARFGACTFNVRSRGFRPACEAHGPSPSDTPAGGVRP